MRQRVKTLSLSVFFSSFGPFITFYALFQTTSSTQLADFIRRTVELVVLILALVVFKSNNKTRLKSLYEYAVGGVLMISGVIIVGLSVRDGFRQALPEGTIWFGLAVAFLGIFFNGYFWLKYKAYNQEESSSVMAKQSKLYQAKTLVDVSVVLGLFSVFLFSGERLGFYLDTAMAFVVGLYLIVRGWRVMRQHYKEGECVEKTI